jgi:SpoVK/Ycf46/Vps4 family AAA+-type ATPase
MNLLLSGPPGTGKTEFVKHLGATLDTKVIVRMGSDLLSMYVGGTEHNLAGAFREAREEKAILFFDEIDGLMQSRAGAQRSWEETQVNELLHQMENFNGVFVGATNFSANLDSAAMRRFTFKLQFDWLDAGGKKLFFERMFKTALSEPELARLARIPNLAPGDFRAARQSLYYLGNETVSTDCLAALEQESEAKRNNHFAEKSRIGFA